MFIHPSKLASLLGGFLPLPVWSSPQYSFYASRVGSISPLQRPCLASFSSALA